MDTTILIVEDEEGMVFLLRHQLQQEGYRVVSADNGVAGLQIMHQQQPHLVLLDVMLPRMNGWETCRKMREISDAPIIILTALDREDDKVRGLELGADDFVTKPFTMPELVARVRAALRRYRYPMTDNSVVRLDDRLKIDRIGKRVVEGSHVIELSPTEYRLLEALLDNAGRISTRQSLLTQVWGWEYVDETNYLKVYIHNLRKKLEKDPHNPRLITTERGLGYRLIIN